MKSLLAATLTFAAAPAAAQQFVPPAGYGGQATLPAVAMNPEPGTPTLASVDTAAIAGRFRIDPAYSRAAHSHVAVIGAYAVAERPGARIVDAWSPGYLPVTLAYSDGRCFTLSAAYEGSGLSNARLASVPCGARRGYQATDQPVAPAGLRPLGNPWGFGAWLDPRSATTLIGAPQAKTFTPLLTGRMDTIAVMAMNSPDAPLADLTFVGRVDGRLMVVTVELTY